MKIKDVKKFTELENPAPGPIELRVREEVVLLYL